MRGEKKVINETSEASLGSIRIKSLMRMEGGAEGQLKSVLSHVPCHGCIYVLAGYVLNVLSDVVVSLPENYFYSIY